MFQDPQEENIKIYREYYSSFAREYEERNEERARVIAETMRRWLGLKNLRILDLGVGTASIWEKLYLQGVKDIQVIGLDIAPGALSLAREKGIPWLEVLEKGVEDCDYLNRFDLVCAHGLLRHLANPMVVIEKVGEALVKEGKFFLEDVSFEDDFSRVLRKLVERIRHYLKPTGRKSSFHLKDEGLVRLVEEGGFRLRRNLRMERKILYSSFEEIKNFLAEKTMFGLYAYQKIPLLDRKRCDRIFLRTLEEELEEPVVWRRRLMGLFEKRKSPLR
jgi:SAM-dependent methyltransferase